MTHVLRTAVICCKMNISVTTGLDFDLDEKQNSISVSQLVVLLPTKCVTGERDSLSPRKVHSSPSIHTRSYTPSVRWILKRLVFWGLIVKPGIASGCEVGVNAHYKPTKFPLALSMVGIILRTLVLSQNVDHQHMCLTENPVLSFLLFRFWTPLNYQTFTNHRAAKELACLDQLLMHFVQSWSLCRQSYIGIDYCLTFDSLKWRLF